MTSSADKFIYVALLLLEVYKVFKKMHSYEVITVMIP